MTFVLRILSALSLSLILTLLPGCGGFGPTKPDEVKPAEPPVVMTQPIVVDRKVAESLSPEADFLLGIENELAQGLPNLRRRRIMLYVSSGSLSTKGVHTVEIIRSLPDVSLPVVVSVDDLNTSATPTLMRAVGRGRNFGLHQFRPGVTAPTPPMFANIDAVVWDVPLPAQRTSVEAASLAAALDRCAAANIPFIVLDRPNLIDSSLVDGPLSDLALSGTETAFFPVPLLPGLTAGELARLYNLSFGVQARLTVVPMKNWKRGDENAWLSLERPLLPEDRLAALDELRSHPRLQHGFEELAIVAGLLGDGLYTATHPRLSEEGIPVLPLAPKEIPALALMERFSTVKLPAGVEPRLLTDAAGGTELVLVALADQQISPTALALALRAAAAQNSRKPPQDSTPFQLGNETILPSLARGLTPDQLRRRWMAGPDYSAYLAEREKALLYKP